MLVFIYIDDNSDVKELLPVFLAKVLHISLATFSNHRDAKECPLRACEAFCVPEGQHPADP